MSGIDRWSPLHAGTNLAPGDIIRTGQGTVVLRMIDSGSFVKVTPNVMLRLAPLEQGWDRGVLSGAEPMPADAPVAGRRRPVLSLGRPAPPDDRRRRATRECLLALAAVEAMLEDGKAGARAIAGERTALLYATAAGYAASNRGFIEGSGGSIHFAYTAPAVVPAEVAIEFGVTGPYAIFLGGPPATLRAIWQAAILLESGACDRALVLSVEIFEECADLYARARRLTGRPLVEAGPLELSGSWRGEQARLVWRETS